VELGLGEAREERFGMSAATACAVRRSARGGWRLGAEGGARRGVGGLGAEGGLDLGAVEAAGHAAGDDEPRPGLAARRQLPDGRQ
jgi:hypothetical protein